MQGRTGTGSLVTISSSIVEFGNASGAGGGVQISIKTHKTNMPLSERNHSPISVIIDDSTFQNNSAGYRGGGISISFEQLCCSASVNITNTQLMHNRVDRKLIDGTNADTTGGNIDILHIGGQWLQSTVRIENSLIKGGMAGTGGGMSLIQQVYVWQNNTDNVPIEVLYISNTQFICNRAYSKTGGSSLLAGVQFSIHLPLQSNTPAITHLFNIKNTLFDGTCSDISNIKMVGERYISYPTTTYNVIFSNVSVQGHLMKPSPPPASFQTWALLGAHYVSTITSLQPGINLHYVSNVTFINCTFNESSPDSAIALSGTTIIFEGNITFSGNRGTYGGGMSLVDNSFMFLRPNTRIIFSNNHATYVGGGIYVHPDILFSGFCFFQMMELANLTKQTYRLNLKTIQLSQLAVLSMEAMWNSAFISKISQEKTYLTPFLKCKIQIMTPVQYLLIHTVSAFVEMVECSVKKHKFVLCTHIQEHCSMFQQ